MCGTNGQLRNKDNTGHVPAYPMMIGYKGMKGGGALSVVTSSATFTHATGVAALHGLVVTSKIATLTHATKVAALHTFMESLCCKRQHKDERVQN